MNLHRSEYTDPRSPNLFTRPGRAGKVGLAAALLACAALTFSSGCSKKEEPKEEPPPVEAPPPPPPTVVSFDSISQELGVHPAVQFAPGLALSDESLVRATIKLADALARGDAGKLRPLVSKPAERTIKAAEASQIWDSGMADIEAVRVIYAGPVDHETGKLTLETVVQILSGKPGADASMLTPELATKIGQIVGKAMASETAKTFDPALATPENFDKMLKSIQENMGNIMEKFLTDSKYEAERKEVEALLATAESNSDLPTGDFVVLLAVQHKDGAELSGWGAEKAFSKWQFNNGTTITETKPRASEFDGIGLAGFSPKLAKAAPATEGDAKPATEGGAKPDEAKPDEAKPKKDDGPDPTKKRTPAGPINIPGPSGG